MKPKVLIISGNGINCEIETAKAFELAGAIPTILNIEDILVMDSFDDFSIMAFPGGFSFGDEIRSGQILAEQIKLKIKKQLDHFIAANKPIIGICNGFQILVQLGVFGTHLALGINDSQKFQNEWVDMEVVNTEKSFWLSHLEDKIFSMPARHKEGNLQGKLSEAYPVFKYTKNFNGSIENTAALINKKGNILGIMPHPEAALHPFLFHRNEERSEFNQQLFKNAVNHIKEKNS